jgi:CheY-like chemotaxis protein
MRVLVVDDERSVADTLVMVLRYGGHQAAAAYEGGSALTLAEAFRPDCVICDVVMPGMNGIEVCAAIQTSHPDCHILLFSGQAVTTDLTKDAIGRGYNWELLTKPVPPDEFLAKLASLKRYGDAEGAS